MLVQDSGFRDFSATFYMHSNADGTEYCTFKKDRQYAFNHTTEYINIMIYAHTIIHDND